MTAETEGRVYNVGGQDWDEVVNAAAEEAGDWAGAEALNGARSGPDGDDQLIGFARKLSRQPWQMTAADLEGLRSLGYAEPAILHVISVVAHQNADSRLVLGLDATG